MTTKNMFNKPFDEGTIAKLEIFENYLKSWLPTFIMTSGIKPIQIFDLFAGSGYDSDKTEGSPLRTLRIINEFKSKIREKNKLIYLYFNDSSYEAISILEENCLKRIKEYDIKDIIKIEFTNITFSDFIHQSEQSLQNGCNLIFIDQYGFKEVTEDVFRKLTSFEKTEFLFFISSTHIHRFSNRPEIVKYHPKFNFDKIRASSRKVVHNIICEEFKQYIPSNITSYSLIPFSIMKSKKNNIYGIIFFSKHILGADKFLKVAWTMDSKCGNANYDINEEVKNAQQNLFYEQPLPKIDAFKDELKKLILSKKLCNNVEIYVYTLNNGHIPKHAHDKLVELKKENIVDYEGRSPLINYDKIFNEHRFIEIKVL